MDNQNQSSFTTAWRGFHHIALVTPDLDGTIAFYGDVLGMTVGEIFPASPQRGRHCFIKPGDGNTWGLHFFEYSDAEIFQGSFEDRFAFLQGAMQHIAFAIQDEAAALGIRRQLEHHQIDISPINTIGNLRNFLFTDNNGILLEAMWDQV